METGKAEYLRVKDMKEEIDLLKASASLPYVSRIVHAKGMKLLDGGCTDSIPVKAFRDMGFSKTVVVLTQHKGYVKQPEKSALSRLFYRKYPEFAQAVKNRPQTYNQTIKEIEEWEKAGEIFVIRPTVPLEVNRTKSNPDELQKAYDMGRNDALAKLDEMTEWMSK